MASEIRIRDGDSVTVEIRHKNCSESYTFENCDLDPKETRVRILRSATPLTVFKGRPQGTGTYQPLERETDD